MRETPEEYGIEKEKDSTQAQRDDFLIDTRETWLLKNSAKHCWLPTSHQACNFPENLMHFDINFEYRYVNKILNFLIFWHLNIFH